MSIIITDMFVLTWNHVDLCFYWPYHSAYLHLQSQQTELRAQLKKKKKKKNSVETSPLQKSERKQNQWPVASNILWRRTSIAASTTNPHWHMQPLTVVYGESGPPVSMQRITMAWHSLWINCACWHAPLTVSNSACDLCTAVPNILLEWGHKSAERCLTLYAIIHTPCFNCPIWRWCKHEQTLLLLAFAAPSLLISCPHFTQMQCGRTNLEQINMAACGGEFEQDLQWRPALQRRVKMHAMLGL